MLILHQKSKKQVKQTEDNNKYQSTNEIKDRKITENKKQIVGLTKENQRRYKLLDNSEIENITSDHIEINVYDYDYSEQLYAKFNTLGEPIY